MLRGSSPETGPWTITAMHPRPYDRLTFLQFRRHTGREGGPVWAWPPFTCKPRQSSPDSHLPFLKFNAECPHFFFHPLFSLSPSQQFSPIIPPAQTENPQPLSFWIPGQFSTKASLRSTKLAVQSHWISLSSSVGIYLPRASISWVPEMAAIC